MSQFALRPVEASDLDAIFEQMRDQESVRMAAFTAEDPNERSAFDAHMAKIMSSSENTFLAIIRDARLVGTIASYPSDGGTELSFAPGRAAEIEETILELP
jgi:RimJ/RimL family protein N-acetyltransferase